MKLVLICEGSGDDADLRAVTWSVLRAAHAWLKDFDDPADAGYPWVEFDGARFLKWSRVKELCDRQGVPRVHGLNHGLGYSMARRPLNLLSVLPDADAANGLRVVMVHDSDGEQVAWTDSLTRARDTWLAEELGRRKPLDVDAAIGVAHPEHEAWKLAVFAPRTDAEQERLRELQQQLGLDPTRSPEALSSGRSTHRRDAKRVLDRLLAGDAERRAGLLRDASVVELIERGWNCGLALFVAELTRRVAPIGGVVDSTELAALLIRLTDG